MIDLLRGVFALLVVVGHTWAATFHRLPDAGADQSLAGFLSYILGNAGFWVAGFFVISGFCIQLSIRGSLRHSPFRWGRYLLARFTRIYPLTIAGLLVASVVWFVVSPGLAFPWRAWAGTLFMAQNFVGLFPHYEQSWSLTNEFVYYLVWPVFLAISLFHPRRALALATAAATVLTTTLVVLWKWKADGRSDHWSIPVWTTAASIIWWLAGVALYEFWPALARFATARRCLYLLPSAGVPCLLAFFAGYCGSKTWVLFLATYLAIPFFCLLMLTGRHLPWLATQRGRNISTLLGVLSFPLYVFHLQWVALLSHWRTVLGWPNSDRGAFVLILLAILGVLGPACVAIEKYLMASRKRILARYSQKDRSE